MPFERPSLAELIDRVGGDLRGRLEITGPILRRAMADVLSSVWAGAVHTLYGYLDWLARQLFGDTAEREALLRMASLYGITPVPATFATGNVTATGTNGTSIPAETILRLDAATAYRVTTGQVIALGTATLPVEAILAGSAANLIAGASLSFENPIDFVTSTATVATGGITGGVDEEGTEELRDRYLLRLREPPQGGADQDYEAWALAVAGVTRAWVYPHELGLGTVVVRFVLDNEPSIFPDVGDVAAVQAALEEQRPITAEVTAAAPIELQVDFTIELTPDNADTRAAVEAELADLLRRVAEPGDGAGRGTVLISQIRTAIGIAEGVEDYTMTVPSSDVTPGIGELLTVGTFTWL
ncbi:MAG TPA: baseplate J/gp47 family protein [Candidatus Binatia bacterium]|nr:baseplate J/gp47 family protein [Candidatus Binatia bacterium]